MRWCWPRNSENVRPEAGPSHSPDVEAFRTAHSRKFRECSPPLPRQATLAPFRLWLHGVPGAGREIPGTITPFPRRREHAGERRRRSRTCRNPCAGTPDSATVAATVRSEYWGYFVSVNVGSCRADSRQTRPRYFFPRTVQGQQRFANTLREVTSAADAACQETPSIFGPSFPEGRLASASRWRHGC